jgi:adenosylmethionine-8-amino-7-oxononanoate aminotransferase
MWPNSPTRSGGSAFATDAVRMNRLAQLDRAYLWHPFTQMRDWLRTEPIVIVAGQGAVLRDTRGREYLDANSSIWTNLHGHNNPRINAAIGRQLKKIAHSSALGLANEPASVLAAKLVQAANPPLRAVGAAAGSPFNRQSRHSKIEDRKLAKVFFSDDGSTAVEVALKLAYEFARRNGPSRRPKFLSLAEGYHGDTVGAVALGHIDRFHRAYRGLVFRTDKVMAPYCYRCPFNRAAPERADARACRKCNWECVDEVERAFRGRKDSGESYAAFAFEPLIQGAAGMIPQPPGWLRQACQIARGHGALLIADEVMTGFGRTGCHSALDSRSCSSLFASHHEDVQPDFLCLAKGLTGGYLPMAATLTTQAVFDAFLGEYDEFKTFFHGHSYTANQLGSAAARASLDLLLSQASQRSRRRLESTLATALSALWSVPQVGDIRQVGLIAGIELVRDWRTREPFDPRERAGMRVCEAMANRGVLTRPIGNVIVLMPPYCATPQQVRRIVSVLGESIEATFRGQR